jgi:hypothetical protein
MADRHTRGRPGRRLTKALDWLAYLVMVVLAATFVLPAGLDGGRVAERGRAGTHRPADVLQEPSTGAGGCGPRVDGAGTFTVF